MNIRRFLIRKYQEFLNRAASASVDGNVQNISIETIFQGNKYWIGVSFLTFCLKLCGISTSSLRYGFSFELHVISILDVIVDEISPNDVFFLLSCTAPVHNVRRRMVFAKIHRLRLLKPISISWLWRAVVLLLTE